MANIISVNYFINIKFIIDKAQKRTTHTALDLFDAFLHLANIIYFSVHTKTQITNLICY